MEGTFPNRAEAGRLLAEKLSKYAGRGDVVVLGLPRGGVPVAYEVAKSLSAPLVVLAVRKLGVPGHEELALGAIAPGGVRVVNDVVAAAAGFGEKDVAALVADEQRELDRQEQLYRGDLPPASLRDKIVILV